MRFHIFTRTITIILVMMTLTSSFAQDNLLVEYNGATGFPDFINICGAPDTARMKIRVTGLESEVRENIRANVQLFPGAEFVEFLGANSSSGVSLLTSDLTTATFQIPNLDPTSPNIIDKEIELAFTIKADCRYMDTIALNNEALVVDTWTFDYNLDGSAYKEVEQTAIYKDAFAVPNLTMSSVENVVVKSRGDVFDRDVILSNAGLSGFIDSLNYAATYGPGIMISQVKINGVVYPITETADGRDTTYQIVIDDTLLEGNTLGGVLGNANQSLDPNESLTITETVHVLSCEDKRDTDYRASWGCYGSTCELEEMSNFISIGTGAPNPVARNSGSTPNVQTGYCQDGSQTVTFTNEGTEVDEGYGTMRDVELGIGLGMDLNLSSEYFEIFEITVAGQTITTDTSMIRLDQFAQFTSDPDGDGVGLMDSDGDGYFDDLPIGESIEITVGFRFLCANANGTDNSCENEITGTFNSRVQYTNACAERKLLENNSVTRVTNISPDSESSTAQTDADIVLDTFHVQYFQLRTAANFAKNCGSNEELIVKVALPDGVSVEPTKSNLFRNTTLALPLKSANLLAGDTMELRYSAAVSRFVAGEYTLDLAFSTTCDAVPGETVFPVSIAHYCGDCDCLHTWYCGDLEGPVLHPTVPPCTNLPPCPNGVRALSFDVSRTTFGYTDETYTTKVNPEDVNRKVALSCDSVAMNFVTVVGDDVITDKVGAIINYDNPEGITGEGDIFLFDKGNVEVRKSGGFRGTGTVISTASSTTATDLHKKVEIDLSTALQSIGMTLEPGDTILFEGMFSINPDGPYNEQFKIIPNLRGEMYHALGTDTLSCDNFGDVFTVAKTGSLFAFPSSTSYPDGCRESKMEYKVVVYNNDFGAYYANEYIPAAKTDSFAIQFDPAMLEAFEDKTVEVQIPNHPIHGNNFFEIPSLDDFSDGNYVALFDTLNYIPSYNAPIPTLFTLRVNLLPNCSSSTGSEDGNNRYTFRPKVYYKDRYYASYFGDGSCVLEQRDTVNNDISYTKEPTFSLQSLSNPNPQVKTDTVQWLFKHCNESTDSDAGLNWLALDINHTDMSIVSIQEVGGAKPQDLTLSSYGDSNSVFAYVDPLLRNFSTSQATDICNTYLVTAKFNKCGDFPLVVRTGWNCGAYDEADWTPKAYVDCKEDTLNISAKTLEGSLDAEMFNQPTDTVSLCDTLTYEILVKNTDLGDIFDIKTSIEFPFVGLDIIPNSFEFAYPKSGNYVKIPDPKADTIRPEGEKYIYEDFSQVSTFLDENGLQGFNAAAPSDSTEYKLKFKVLPRCNFVSGEQIQYRFQGASVCGNKTNEELGETFPIYIKSIPKSTQFFLAEFGAGTTYLPDGTGKIEVNISNSSAAASDDNDVVRIILPPGVNYKANSVVASAPSTWTPGEPTFATEDGYNIVFWKMPVGVPQSGQIQFFFDVEGNVVPKCQSENFRFSLFTLDKYQVNCKNLEVCDIFSGTTEGGEKHLDINVNNGITVAIIEANTTCIDGTAEQITVAGEITGLLAQSADGTINFFFDANNDNAYTLTDDELLATQTIPSGTNNVLPFEATYLATNAQLCDMKISLALADLGGCGTPDVIDVEPSLQNVGNDSISSCGGVIPIGSDSCRDITSYSYQWMAVAPAKDTEIADVNALKTTVNINPADYPDGTTLQYILRTTRTTGCTYASTDTVNISLDASLAPAVVDANLTTCVSDSVQLEAKGGTSYAWTEKPTNPVANVLTDKNVANPKFSTLVAGTYEFEVEIQGGCKDVTLPVKIEVTGLTITGIPTVLDACTAQRQSVNLVLAEDIVTYTVLSGIVDNVTQTGTNLTFEAIQQGDATSEILVLMEGISGCKGVAQFDFEACICNTPEITGVAVTNSRCGATEGIATINVKGNATDYDFVWTPNQGTANADGNSRTDLGAGVYDVAISDKNNDKCIVSQRVIVGNADGPQPNNVATTKATCGSTDGTATILPNNWIYTWEDGTVGNTRSDLATGIYAVTVAETSSSACTNIIAVSIQEETNLAVTHTVDQAPTCGNTDGNVTLAITGGSGTYNVVWTDGGTGLVRTGLRSGTYGVTVQDTDGSECTTTYVFSMTDSDIPQSAITIDEVTDVSCIGDTNGSIKFSATIPAGLTAPLDTIISNGVSEQTNGALAPGQYCVSIRSNGVCISGSACFEIESPAPLNANVSTLAACSGGGSAIVNVTGGTGAYTFNWADLPSVANPRNRTGLTEGNYQLTVTDANGCTIELMGSVPSCPCAIEPNITSAVIEEATCGNSDGAATIVLEGGLTTGLIYTWLPDVGTVVGDGQTRTNLPAGGYTVTATDASGICSDVFRFVVNTENGFENNITLNTSNANCGTADGEVTLSPATFKYEWQDGFTGATRNDLAAGTYFVSITPTIGGIQNCLAVKEIIIEEDNALSATVNIVTESTCGNAVGTVQADVQGGSGDYSYNWSFIGDNTATVNNVASGVYTLTVTDNTSGCKDETTFVMTDSDVSGATITINSTSNVTCSGTNNGAVDYTIATTASLNEPSTVVITDGTNVYDEDKLSEGEYCIIVYDAAACVVDAQCFTIEEPKELEAEFAVTNACQGRGAIDIRITNGVAPYTYDWADVTGNDNPQNRTNLPTGTYSVIITDANGCTISSEGGLEVTCPSGCDLDLELESVVIEEATCGNDNATVSVKSSVDNALLSYTWKPDVGVSINEYSRMNLPVGSYTVIAVDKQTGLCQDSIVFAVTNADAPVLDAPIATTAADCDGTNGTATLSPSTYNYTWSDGGTGATRNDLAPGTYFVSFTDVSNPICESVVEVNIASNPGFTANPRVVTNPTCGNSDGALTVNVLGGSSTNYSYEWSNGATTPNITGVPSGTYQVTIVDGDHPSCEAIGAIVLTDSDVTTAYTVTIDNTTNVGCNGDADGSVDFTISPAGAATIIITDGTQIYEKDALPQGSYCINVVDVSGCIAGGACFEIEENEPLEAEFLTSGGCNKDGIIISNVTGGSGNYTFDWADLSTGETVNRNNLSKGRYAVTVTDDKGCSITNDSILIDCPDCNIDIEISSLIINEATCGNTDGAVTINTNLDPSTLVFTWSPDAGQVGNTSNSRTNLPAGAYAVTISDQAGICFATTEFAVTNSDAPRLLINPVTTNSDCGSANGTAVLAPNTYNFTWSDGGTGATRNDLASGTYFVSFTDSANPTCEGIAEVKIGVNNILEVETTIDNIPTCGNADGTVTASIKNGAGGTYQYVWSNGTIGATLSNVTSGTYQVTVTDEANDLCSASTALILIDSDETQVPVTITNVTNISCEGENNGTVAYDATIPRGMTAIITDGTNIYENGAIPAGDYCIQVVNDTNGCIGGGACFTITEPPVLEVEFSVADACNNDGSIIVSVSGGTGTYTYDWLDIPGSSNDSTRTQLSTGLYSIVITDANDCAVFGYEIPVTCSQCKADQLIDYTVSYDSQCEYNVGSATVFVNGNASDYNYTWNPSIGTQNTVGNQLDSLPAGVYQVVVTDKTQTACADSVYITVANSDAPKATVESTNPSICGQATGSATFTPASLTYEWSDGGTGASRNDLAKGLYEVKYFDADNPACFNVTQVEITDTVVFQIVENVIQLPDCNTSNGTVELQVTGGSGTYSYVWSNGAMTSTVDNLSAGTYTVTVTDDSNGCEEQHIFALNNKPTSSTAEIQNIQVVDVVGDSIGSVTFDVNYGAGFAQPSVVTITDGFNAYSQDALPVGNYCITVQDANGCVVDSDCFEVVSKVDPFTINVAVTQVDCDSKGAFNIMVNGGVAPYTYDWADITTSPEPEDRTNLDGGVYNLTVTDARGIELAVQPLTIDTVCLNPVCEFLGQQDTMTFSLLNCADTVEICTSLSFDDYLIGDYTLTVDNQVLDVEKDARTCETNVVVYPNIMKVQGVTSFVLDSWELNGSSNYTGTFTSYQQLVDSMNVWDTTGDWKLTADDASFEGTGSGTYGNMVVRPSTGSQQITTISKTSSQSVINISIPFAGEGTHTIAITNNITSCTDSITAIVSCNRYELVDEITLGDSVYVCLDQSDIIANTILSGDSIVSIQNTCESESGNSVVFTADQQSPPCISYTGIRPGTEKACWLVCDNLGVCDTITYTVTVVPTGIEIVTDTLVQQQVDTLCLDSVTNLAGEIVSVNNYCDDNSPELSFTYLDTEDDFCILIEAEEIGRDSACFAVTDAYGNIDTVLVYIDVTTTQSETIVDTIYVGESVEFCLDSSELTAPVAYIDNICEGDSEYAEFFLEEDKWCVTYKGVEETGTDSACIVLCDINGVCDTTYFNITVVRYYDLPVAINDFDTTVTNVPVIINVKANDTVFGGVDSLYILDQPLGGNAFVNLDCTISYEPNAGICETTDSFTYVVCNPNVCDTATVYVYIECTEITPFNGFSPNGDGINDVFYIGSIKDFPNNKLCVYNRWGELVYEKKGYNNEWDGTWSGYDLPSGTYFYVLTLGDEDNQKLHGYIQLQR